MIWQLLLAFAPSLPSDKPHIQSIYVVIVLTGYGLLQAHYWPWKAPEFNLLDVTISIGLIAVVVIATSFVPASKEGNTYETLLFVVISLIGLVVSLLLGRICLHVLQRKGSFGPDAHHLSEKLAVEVFQKIEHVAKKGEKAFVANAQQMNHYDTIAMMKGIDVYAVVAMNAAPTTSMRLTGIERSTSSKASQGLKVNVAGTKQSGEINDSGVSVEIKVDALVVV